MFALYPVTISDVTSTICLLSSSYVAITSNPSKSKFSPFTYSVLLGADVISIFSRLLCTVTLKLAVFPWYVTVISCSPNLFALYPVTMFGVTSTFGLLPSSYTAITSSPLKSKFCPCTYVVLLGIDVISIFSKLLCTVTIHWAFLFPSFVLTVIVAVPVSTAVTVILLFVSSNSAIAIFSSLLVTVTFLLLAVSGFTVATNSSACPFIKLISLLFNSIPSTGVFTVIVLLACFPPSSVVTVIVAVPFDIPVTFPSESTVAILLSLLSHITFLLSASSGCTVATNFILFPTSTVVDPFNITL